MSDVLAPHSPAPVGYRSEESKRRFTLITGLLGAACFFAQFLIPFAIAFYWTSHFPRPASEPSISLSSSAFWNGAVWYGVEPGYKKPGEGEASLWSLSRAPGSIPVKRADLPEKEPRFLADADRLWIIYPDRMGYWKEGKAVWSSPSARLGDISSPFLYKGTVHVVQQTPEGYSLVSWVGDGWERGAALDLRIKGAKGDDCLCGVRMVPEGETLHAFQRSGNTLFYRRLGPKLPSEAATEEWKPLGGVTYSWWALPSPRGPQVLSLAEGFREIRLEGWANGEWKTRERWPSTSYISMDAVYPLGQDDRFLAALHRFSRGPRLEELIVGKPGPAPDKTFPAMEMGSVWMIVGLPQAINLLLPLLLACILSGLMQKHRITDYTHGSRTLRQAGLWRRAVAQLVDGILLAAPLFGGVAWLIKRGLEDAMPEDMFQTVFIYMGVAAAWVFVALVLFSWWEGTKGYTPGKWIMRIKVLGLDLEPCGFWRALVRNLLKFVDGFFNFLVGILITALSEHWQRLGDLAARTVVLRCGAPIETPESIPPC